MVNSTHQVSSPLISNKEKATEWFERVWNHGDTAHIKRVVCPGFRVEGLRIHENNADGFIEFQQRFRESFRDIWIEVSALAEDGEVVAGLGNLTAIHSVSRKPVNSNFGIFQIWREEKLVECRTCLDFSSLLEQVGLIDKSLVSLMFKKDN